MGIKLTESEVSALRTWVSEVAEERLVEVEATMVESICLSITSTGTDWCEFLHMAEDWQDAIFEGITDDHDQSREWYVRSWIIRMAREDLGFGWENGDPTTEPFTLTLRPSEWRLLLDAVEPALENRWDSRAWEANWESGEKKKYYAVLELAERISHIKDILALQAFAREQGGTLSDFQLSNILTVCEGHAEVVLDDAEHWENTDKPLLDALRRIGF